MPCMARRRGPPRGAGTDLRAAGRRDALDPEVVTELFARRRGSPLDSRTPREREVLELMAEGRAVLAHMQNT